MMSDNALTASIQDLLAEIFQAPREEITPNLAFGDLPQWDSMGHMDVMMSLEEKFGVEISTDVISELTSIPAICSYLKEKLPNG